MGDGEGPRSNVDSATAEPAPAAVPAVPMPEGQTLREATDAFQRAWIAAALARHPGHLSHAAREAGMDGNNVHRLLRRLGLGGSASVD